LPDLQPADRPVVLLVEDDVLVRMFQAEFLEEVGFGVVEADTADQALEVVEGRNDIRVLWTDIEMPGALNGLALAYIVRERHPGMAILISSGRRFPSDRDLPPGAAFFGKPFHTERVLTHLKALLG
jgi:DNA-binding NtrC family response regulator